ncbi:MAG: hypothetical protein LC126_20520 [Bryobacterales bacterium]|nr:hypothetical protein [Bryobacterales bacterium]
MSAAPAPGFQKSFPLDPGILGDKSALALELGGTTDMDVALAITTNKPFPTRPDGVIDLAHISLSAAGGKPVAFQGGGGLTVGFQFSAGVTAGAAVFDDPNAAIKALGLGETPGLDLSIEAAAGSRYALLRTGYTASGSVSGSHPIGAIGSVTFGASGASSGISAVLHRFSDATGADDVLSSTVRGWKLPRHVLTADKIEPATWVAGEASGSLAVNIGAKLGYDFNFVREVKAFGLSGDIGLKIDAAATATFGFEVSGRYLVVIGRESSSPADEKLRLRLFKLSSSGMQFGLNLNVGVTGVETLTPGKADDFVKAVFGVHGAQIVNVLAQIDKWTDPNRGVGQLVAGLVNDKALQLLQDFTGVDPKTAFNEARAKLLGAIRLYQSLPTKVASELTSLLGQLDAPAFKSLQDALTLLSSANQDTQTKAFLDLLGAAGFADTPAGKLLTAAADRGLLNLLDRLPEVRGISATIQSILDGGIIAKLQSFINTKLDLDKFIRIASQADFDKLDSFLVGRLSAFFDKQLAFAHIDEIRAAIRLVTSKRQEIYDKAKTALNSRYGLEVAAAWQRTSASTAIVDAVFDTSDAKARALLEDVLTSGNAGLDNLFTTPLSTVQLNAAVLTHELTRKSTLEISLPRFNFQTQSVTTALANVHPEDDGGRILLYDATGSATVTVRNKFTSGLTVTIAAAISRLGFSSPDLRIHPGSGNTWTYRLLYAKPKMKREELEAVTRPFLIQYMAGHFATGTSLSTWYNMLESTSEEKLHNGPETYGDLCASFEVTIPGDALGAWLLPIANVKAAAQQMSVAIQRSLRSYLTTFYLSDIGKLANLASSAPLLAWASLPAAVKFNGTDFSETGGGNVFWDHVDITLRRAAASHSTTAGNLLAMLPELRLRLEEAGLHGTVQFYQNPEAGNILSGATTPFGDILFESLLLFEAQVVEKANDALKDIQKFLSVAGTSPTQAVKRLADFAADITSAFGKLIGNSVFADLATFRAVAQMVFAEASRTLGGAVAAQPRAMLTLDILNPAPPRAFQLADFLEGAVPSGADIAVAQRLVTT